MGLLEVHPVKLPDAVALGDIRGDAEREGLGEPEPERSALRETDAQAERVPLVLVETLGRLEPVTVVEEDSEPLGLREREGDTDTVGDVVPVALADAHLVALRVSVALEVWVREGDTAPVREAEGNELMQLEKVCVMEALPERLLEVPAVLDGWVVMEEDGQGEEEPETCALREAETLTVWLPLMTLDPLGLPERVGEELVESEPQWLTDSGEAEAEAEKKPDGVVVSQNEVLGEPAGLCE